jgi:plastocyanin
MRFPALLVALAIAGATGAGPSAGGATVSAQSGPGGTLRGRVDMRRTLAVTERRPPVADLTAPSARPAAPEGRPVVVFLEAPDVPAGSDLRTARAQPGRARMDQRDETFSPHAVAVNVGSTVDFPNNDRTFHNVFSLSKAKRFDLGRYGRGQSQGVRFDQPGVVRVFCDIHSHMSAFVLVFNHPYHAAVDDNGRYRIDNIPPGTYTVVAWQDGDARDTRTVTIPAPGAVVDLDLLVR